MTINAAVPTLDKPREVAAWLQQRPTAQALRTAFPDEWITMEQELQAALSQRDSARLHHLLHPAMPPGGNPRHARRELVRVAVRQRMAALTIEHYGMAAVTGKASGTMRFNLFNGWLAQRLLFRRDLERKAVPLLWFRLLWPLVWQKRLLMPLVTRKGIYCFYSDAFVRRVAEIIGERSCLEIAAGDGTLSRFLRQEGIQVRATDNYSWHDRISFPADVERLEAIAAIRKYAPEVVLCSWPPSQNNFEREVFQTASVRIYLVVVSIHHFASGNWSDYASQQSFAMEHRPDLARLLLPPELGCDVLLFRRNGSRAESSRGEHD
ncbi:hypothetical protein CLU90_5740 [Janthinobacterium sp. 67]|jgi:hypothetical protein|nr:MULTISPECIES: SAM-dependent methyltransferase [Janthinobacterium]PJJ06769.1 hypothetical protein CLU90_5740 [Janthinobacterium sp. 67]